MILDRRVIGLRVQRNRLLALFRMTKKPRRRSLLHRLRKVMYPRARKTGPVFPSIRPSRPNLQRVWS